MAKINALLTERLKKTESSSKMAELAQQSANGTLSSFSGLFTVEELSHKERLSIESILHSYQKDALDISVDLKTLLFLTAEVKAINNQAALLHGERIKKAQMILTRYKDGAFTAWLIAAYGNRQTPYNLLQYYEFCHAMPANLRFQIELMPRQAIYSLATRQGPLEKKREFVEHYNGQGKVELLARIRELFPIKEKDKRRRLIGEFLINGLKKLLFELKQGSQQMNKEEKSTALALIEELYKHI